MQALPQNNLQKQLELHSSKAVQNRLSLNKPRSGTFSFKKKSASGITKVAVLPKVTISNALVDRDVNAFHHSKVTKPLTSLNKPEEQQARINSLFEPTHKAKSQNFTPVVTRPPVSNIKLSLSTTKASPQSALVNTDVGKKNDSEKAVLNNSLSVSIDDWDDFDDFDFGTPVKEKSVTRLSQSHPGENFKKESASNLNKPCLKTSRAAETILSESSDHNISNGLQNQEPLGAQNGPAVLTDQCRPLPDAFAAVEKPQGCIEDKEEEDDVPIKFARKRHLSQIAQILSDSEDDCVEEGDFPNKKKDLQSKQIDTPIAEIDNRSENDNEELDFVPPSPESETISPLLMKQPSSGAETHESSYNGHFSSKELVSKQQKHKTADDGDSEERKVSGTDSENQLFSIMEEICQLVDSIPEHELTALSCGRDLLFQRARRRRFFAESCRTPQAPRWTGSHEASNAKTDNQWSHFKTPVSHSSSFKTIPSGKDQSSAKSFRFRKPSSVPFADGDGSVFEESDLSDIGGIQSPSPSYRPRGVPNVSFNGESDSRKEKLGVGNNGKDSRSDTFYSKFPSFSSAGNQMPNLEETDDCVCLADTPSLRIQSKTNNRVSDSHGVDPSLDDIDNEFTFDNFDIDDFDEQDMGDYFEGNDSASKKQGTEGVQPVREGHPSKSLWEKKSPSSSFLSSAAKPSKPTSECKPINRNPAHDRFRGCNFPYSQEMTKIFNKRFGLRQFRTNQLEAINATLHCEDTFVLMPTGGGKSLCYQLPACVSPGVTIVISPLRSLIVDQVQKLTTLDIPAAGLTGFKSDSESARVYMQLSKKDPIIKLLYCTPEKVCASNKFISALRNLYERSLLSRIVIDEAHCVSQWGHDFRPDYKRLHELRRMFPSVPIMALTATANPRVQKDILNQLQMLKPQVFTMSFNRHNLKYAVLPKKPKKIAEDCLEWIKKYHPRDSGIIYCLSRNNCDSMAESLQRGGITALAYHAGLKDSDRDYVQQKWIEQDECQVMCATIAFGMGIDKPDVRFVIHASLPKSVEGYYQESGRAGRDGEISHCVLFYSYNDAIRIKRLINMERDGNKETKQTHITNLYSMVHFCENVVECRRTQLLAYFGERTFNPNFCKEHPDVTCDNCARAKLYKSRNVTEEVKNVVRFVQEHCAKVGVRQAKSAQLNRLTLNMLVDIFIGTKSARIQTGLYGKGAAYSRHNAERLFRKLVLENVLEESLYITANDQAVAYISAGQKAAAVLSGFMQIEFYDTESASSIKKHRASVTKNMSKREEMVQNCLQELNNLCKKLGKIFGIHYYNIFSTATLKKIAETLSADPEVLLQIDGVTEDKLEKYGAELIQLLQKYSDWQLPVEEHTEKPVGNDGWIDVERNRREEQELCDEDAGGSSYFKSTSERGGKRKKPSYFNKAKRRKGGYNSSIKGNNARASSTASKGGSRDRGQNSAGSSKPAMATKRPGFMAPPVPRSNQRPFLKPAFSHM
ncbi:BLM protein, partial [Atractosteus spatula]|nr:BLM protein [Atractosteus spatula]